MTLGLSPDAFGDAFAVSDVSKQFANGNPSYVAGINGCELARKVLSETNISFHDTEDGRSSGILMSSCVMFIARDESERT